jgi:plasmid stability protein
VDGSGGPWSGRPQRLGGRTDTALAVASHANDAYIVGMATLNIRNLPDEVHRRLRMRAAEHGRSMEAEARTILAEACSKERKRRASADEAMAKARRLQAFVDKLYGGNKPKKVVDDLIAERRREAEREASE